MRMWMLPPHLLCRQHLLGEHNEIHKLVGAINKSKNIKGFLEKQWVFPQLARTRHDALMLEMTRRGYKHKTLLPLFTPLTPPPQVMLTDELAQRNRKDLMNRCPKCAANMRMGQEFFS